jgi:hypothetical protein
MILPNDLAMAIAEKCNPTARTCIMSICKRGMPGIPLFADVGVSFYGEVHVVTFAESFKEEGTFTAANMAAVFYHLKAKSGFLSRLATFAQPVENKGGKMLKIPSHSG